MSVDDFDESRRIAPVWRRIMILLAVIAAVPVVLWSITAFVRAYVAPPAVPTFRPITATASVPTTRAPDAVVPAAAPATAPARALAAIVRSTAIEDNKLPAPQPPIVEAKATTSDARGIPPVVDAQIARQRRTLCCSRSQRRAATSDGAFALRPRRPPRQRCRRLSRRLRRRKLPMRRRRPVSRSPGRCRCRRIVRSSPWRRAASLCRGRGRPCRATPRFWRPPTSICRHTTTCADRCGADTLP